MPISQFGRSGSRRTSRMGRRSLALALSILLLAVAFPVTRVTHATVKQSSSSATVKNTARERQAEFVPGEVLVRFRSEAEAPGGDTVSTSVALQEASGEKLSVEVERFDGSELVEGLRMVRTTPENTLAAVAALRERDDVLYAEPNYIRHKDSTVPNDPLFSQMYALRNQGQLGGTIGADIKATDAWDLTQGSSDVVVGIVDTGIDITHPDLAPNIWQNPLDPVDGVDNDGNGRVDDVNGWDFFHNDRTVFDPTDACQGDTSAVTDDHGTHVAGTIGAAGNNGTGVTGINWRVKLMSLKFLGPCGSGSDANAISAIRYAIGMRARGINIRVLNNSWGGGPSNQALSDAIQEAGNAGILFIAAAGNDSVDDDDFPHYPSNFSLPNMVSVASTNRLDNLSGFSNFGSRSVHVGAPGSAILSTYPGLDTNGQPRYASFSGTSMATPHVTGVAALVLARHPDISMQRLRAALMFSGDVATTTSLANKVASLRRLNARAALENSDDADSTPPAIAGLGVQSQLGRVVTLQFQAGDDGVSGTPALFIFNFTAPNGAQYHIGSFRPQGSSHVVPVLLPYKQASGVLHVGVIDNAGNGTTADLAVNVSAAAADPYVVTESAPEPLSSGGTFLGFNADDRYIDFTLPFNFPYFGKPVNALKISSNGALYISAPPIRDSGDADDVPSTRAGLNLQSMIAGLWDDIDLRQCMRSDADVFVVNPGAGRVIFRWQGIPFTQSNCAATPPAAAHINFEIELRADGTIITRYGAGNQGLNPVVGISGGQSDTVSIGTGAPLDAYVVESHTSESVDKDLSNAPTVTFAPRAIDPPPNKAPKVAFSGPPSGAVFTAPANIMLTASATDDDGSISKVEFFNGATLIGSQPGSSNSTYVFPWGNVAAGNYTLTVVATDDRAGTTTSAPINVKVSANSIDGTDFFVRQHYRDFFSREADAAGLNFWTGNIAGCGVEPQCVESKRIDTSAAFFLSTEFQRTGYFVYRTYKVAFGNLPNKPVPLTFQQFLPDLQVVGQGVVGGAPDEQQRVEQNRQAYVESFVTRTDFLARYPAAMSASDFVAALNANTGGALTPAEAAALVGDLNGGARTRAQVLRAVAENAEVNRREFNGAFVLMQYFGYLRRNPDDAPELTRDFQGYNFWLGKLNSFGGDFRRAEMVKAFIISGEYRDRFR